MSVINKMLRDLDARRTDGASPHRPRQAGPAAMQGTVSVQPTALQPPAGRRPWLWLPVLVLLAAAGGAYWYLGMETVATAPAALPVAAVVPSAAVPVPAASVPEPVASATPGLQAPATVEPEPAVVRKSSSRTEAGRAAKPAAAATAGKANEGRKRVVESSAVQAPQPAAAPVAAVALPPSAPLTTAPASPAPLRRQGPVQETLAQAQALWNAGSREPAIELVRDAIAAVERSQPVDTALLAQLAREQARMELAQGRPGAVLDLLTRLEPALSGQADLWAVRGNAAQRLGRHQESVQAYLAALQLRPGESRWMLGAAVSLAALGQLDAAGRQAEQARALGPVSPEVLTYLRQAGVPLR